MSVCDNRLGKVGRGHKMTFPDFFGRPVKLGPKSFVYLIKGVYQRIRKVSYNYNSHLKNLKVSVGGYPLLKWLKYKILGYSKHISRFFLAVL